MQSGAAYSDGGRIYQLLKGGPLADLYRIFNLVGATLVTPLRPRDYDIDAIQRAEISFTQGMQAFLLRLFASSYFLDHRMFPQAADAVADAERIQQESALDIPAELCLSLVYRVAFLRRDAAGARKWWERMEAKKLSHFGVDYWLAQSALFWMKAVFRMRARHGTKEMPWLRSFQPPEMTNSIGIVAACYGIALKTKRGILPVGSAARRLQVSESGLPSSVIVGPNVIPSVKRVLENIKRGPGGPRYSRPGGRRYSLGFCAARQKAGSAGNLSAGMSENLHQLRCFGCGARIAGAEARPDFRCAAMRRPV